MGEMRVKIFRISFRTITELEWSVQVRVRQWEKELGDLTCQSAQIVGIAADPDSTDGRVASVLATFR